MAQGRSTKIISTIQWIWTSRLSIKNSVSLYRRTGYTRGLRHRRERVERLTARSTCRLGETPTFLPQGSTCPPPELVKHSWRELNAFLQGICPSLVQPWTCVYNAPGIRAGSATGGHRRERVERSNGSR